MRYKVIAIEREYASGGREIGERLAKMLDVPCYGEEILERAAAKTGIAREELSRLEESMNGSLLFSLNMLAGMTSGRGVDLTRAQTLALAETEIIRELAVNRCVLIGRSAAGLLRENEHTLRVFIHADPQNRLERAVRFYHCDPRTAESVLRRCDRRRANYFKTTTGVEWRDPALYHLWINSGRIGIDSAAELLCRLIQS